MKSLNVPFQVFLVGIATCILSMSPMTRADEWELNSPYYEDDAWYDISEWFDGNDYNPVDESAGVLDNETYDVASDTGADQDNDSPGSAYAEDDYDYDFTGDDDVHSDDDYDYEPYAAWDYEHGESDSYVFDYDFGFNDASGDDNWFYDFYDDGSSYYSDLDSDGAYDYSYRYYDYDDDGIYDAYSSFSDWDDDGVYDDYNFYTFNDAADSSGQSQSQQQNASSRSAKAKSVSGQIVQKKQVDVRDTQHTLVQLKTQDGSKCFADLGPADGLTSFTLNQGQQISVSGPMAKMGDKKLLVAQQLKADGDSAQIDRQQRRLRGKIQDTRTASVRGREHQFVILKADGKRCLVDLGPTDRLNLQVRQGDQLTVRGPMARVSDKKLLMAQTVTHDGDQTEIDRRERSDDRSNANSQASR